MTQAEIFGISPFFIVSDVPSSLSFYRDRLGFEITFQGPSPDDIFFGIVERGRAMLMFKDSVDAFAREDVDLGRAVVPRDERLDELNHVASRKLIERMAQALTSDLPAPEKA